MERFVDGARQAVQSVDPEGIVFTNAGGWTLSTVVARHPWRLEAHQHLTGAEEFVHFGAPREDLLDTSVMAKFLSAGRNPAVVFSDHALGSWHYVGMTPADLKREFYQTVSGGANPWIAVFTPALMHQRTKTMDVVAESWGFLERHEALFEGDRSAARVAVLRSETTALAYLSAQPGPAERHGCRDREGPHRDGPARRAPPTARRCAGSAPSSRPRSSGDGATSSPGSTSPSR